MPRAIALDVMIQLTDPALKSFSKKLQMVDQSIAMHAIVTRKGRMPKERTVWNVERSRWRRAASGFIICGRYNLFTSF